ncbi:MAG: GTPase, partial [Candidatus Omnitrophota bacterium]
KLNNFRNIILGVLSTLEANIDFPEEEIGVVNLNAVRSNLEGLQKEIHALLCSSARAKVLREGLHVVICGRPNVGKSSLLNALLKEERSIVTKVAGTTRDTIEEIIDIRGIPVRIVDTAGIIEPRDLVEKKAVQRSKKQINSADLVLLVFDGTYPLSREDEGLMKRLKIKKVLAIINKIDLKQRIEKEKIIKIYSRAIEISAKREKNISLLEDEIANLIFKGGLGQSEPLLLGNSRHIQRVRLAQKLIEETLDSLDNKLPVEFIAQGLKEALGFLDDILGKQFQQDLLDRIFSDFCIGK